MKIKINIFKLALAIVFACNSFIFASHTSAQISAQIDLKNQTNAIITVGINATNPFEGFVFRISPNKTTHLGISWSRPTTFYVLDQEYRLKYHVTLDAPVLNNAKAILFENKSIKIEHNDGSQTPHTVEEDLK